MAFLALTLTPVGVDLAGRPQGLATIEQDLATLRAQVPTAIATDFDTYAAGVRAFATALQGVDLTDLQSPATRAAAHRRPGAALGDPRGAPRPRMPSLRWFAQRARARAPPRPTAA